MRGLVAYFVFGICQTFINEALCRHQEAAEATRGYVLAAADGDACEDGKGGRPGRCVGFESQGKRDVIIFCPSVVD